MKPADEVLEQAFAEAESRDLDHQKKWVALVDGNKEQLQTLHLLAAARGLNLTIILDLIHVCEYLWKASLCSHAEGDPAREVWVQERLLRILEGKSSQVAAGMTRSATMRGLKEKDRKSVDACASYLINHADYLHCGCEGRSHPRSSSQARQVALMSQPITQTLRGRKGAAPIR